ncbi:MAG: class I SAM-dependent methyltransferase [Methanomicrobiales archaeon]
MGNDSEAWDKDYSQRGAIWSGSVSYLPPLPPGSRVLELGCGNGKSLAGMCSRSWDVTAIDFSSYAVRMCRPIFTNVPEGTLCVADARNLPFRSGLFDGVIAMHVLSHMHGSDRTRAALEVTRMLKKGGTFLFSGFSGEDFRSHKGAVVESGTTENAGGICTHFFNEDEVLSLFGVFTLQSVTTWRWSLRIRGVEFPRAEIQAIFLAP